MLFDHRDRRLSGIQVQPAVYVMQSDMAHHIPLNGATSHSYKGIILATLVHMQPPLFSKPHLNFISSLHRTR